MSKKIILAAALFGLIASHAAYAAGGAFHKVEAANAAIAACEQDPKSCDTKTPSPQAPPAAPAKSATNNADH